MAIDTAKPDFDSLYRDHYADVHRFVFHLVQDTSLADELTQDAFLKAYQAWDSFRSDAPARIWLFRIARNVCFDYLRSPRSRDIPSLDAAAARGLDPIVVPVGREPAPSVEHSARRAEMSECVQGFVLSLPETMRTPLILHDVEGLTNREIADILGSTLEAAKMRLHRARSRLRRMMDERCDLFHDESNILSCLPAAPDRAEHAATGFVASADIAAP
jgi:RNA polymerase sigma-70 factor (ECF subfamily)